jgi:mRNA-degrading endonuclease RelE of RelBE toxin-antitoxin system
VTEYLYQPIYEERFKKNLQRYKGLRDRIKRQVQRVLANPYHNAELLGDPSGKLNLRGCRSARVGRNFRIIFVICEECRGMPDCQFCFCEGLPDKAVVFLTVGPHQRAYRMR